MKNNFNFDFVCVGFQKCATTTLDAMLRQHSNIVLPWTKEIHLSKWYDKCKNPEMIIKERFFDAVDMEGKKKGIIDPEFENIPSLVSKYIGKDVKLIFIMRNPVDRLYSLYKMALMLGFERVYASTLQGKRIQHAQESFGRWVRTSLKSDNKPVDFEIGKYIDIIREFEKCYNRDNMKFIIFEEYIKNPEKSIREIFDFLEVPFEEIDYNTWACKGNLVAKNKLSFKLNNCVHMLREYARWNTHVSKRGYWIAEKLCTAVFKITMVANNEKMSPAVKKMLQNYYRASKEELEGYLNKDLSEIWF